MASTMFAAELSFGMTLFMLPRCVVAQVPFPPCVELSRRSREFQTCTEYVDRRLRRQPKEKAFGRWVAFYEGPLRRYPPEQYGLYRGRYCTTDRNFKANGDSLMSGYWTVHRKSGQLLVEDIYERGYLWSAKTYDRRNRLREWSDYSIATDEEPYKCYVQKCTWLLGKETVTEYIICKLDGVIAPYFANYVRQLESRAPSGSE